MRNEIISFSFSQYFPGHNHGDCSILEGRLKALRNISEFCKDHRTEYIGEEVIIKQALKMFDGPSVNEYDDFCTGGG